MSSMSPGLAELISTSEDALEKMIDMWGAVLLASKDDEVAYLTVTMQIAENSRNDLGAAVGNAGILVVLLMREYDRRSASSASSSKWDPDAEPPADMPVTDPNTTAFGAKRKVR